MGNSRMYESMRDLLINQKDNLRHISDATEIKISGVREIVQRLKHFS